MSSKPISKKNMTEFIKNNISIIVQGAITRSNINTIANHCMHWRSILPESEIILSISMTDCLKFQTIDSNQPLSKKIRLLSTADTPLLGAINLLQHTCDYILYDENSTATPLPPIKNDAPGPNNINYLIESSQNGLKIASKTYTLRIRNDAVFLNENFISLYLENYDLPRQPQSSIFKQRVLVPWIYTLNPYSAERLPLHVSDWLHFGLTEDIRKLWEIPFYTFQDSVFFEHTKDGKANTCERRFNLRLAVEQYICLNAFQKYCQNLKINYLHDLQSLDLAMDLLLDNFYVFSQTSFNLRINKSYQKEIQNNYKRSICITEDAWLFIIKNRMLNYSSILKGDVDQNIEKLSRGSIRPKRFITKYSKFHENRNSFQNIIFTFYMLILSEKMKSKFLIFPEKFFHDSRFLITRLLGEYYIK